MKTLFLKSVLCATLLVSTNVYAQKVDCKNNQEIFSNSNSKSLEVLKQVVYEHNQLCENRSIQSLCRQDMREYEILEKHKLELAVILDKMFPYMVKDFEVCKNNAELNKLIIMRNQDFPIIHKKISNCIENVKNIRKTECNGKDNRDDDIR